jgi:WD40 repeat protein
VSVGRNGEISAFDILSDVSPNNTILPIKRHVSQDEDEYRCVKMMKNRCKFLVGSMDCKLKIFDSNQFSLVQSVYLPHHEAFRACDYSVVASAFVIGGNRNILGYDARNNQTFMSIPFPTSRGIRSVSIDGHRITFCTGSGEIAFADIRTGGLLPMMNNGVESNFFSSSPPTSHPLIHTSSHSYRLGGGMITPNPFYNVNFAPHPVEHGIFTHKYDRTGLRLFVGGGPAMASLDGCNLALLH